MTLQLTDNMIVERSGAHYQDQLLEMVKLVPIVWPLGGEILLDPNEHCGWGPRGPFDDRQTQDLGNVGANLNRNAGGLSFPFDVQLSRFRAWHRNSNADAQAWGWRIAVQQKTAASNAVTSSDILNQVSDNGGAGPNDYGNNQNQLTDVTFATPTTITAGDVLVLGVEAPTANTTNRYVQIQSGYLLLERV